MEIIKLYINLNNCKNDLQNNQKHRKTQASLCNDYYNCVQTNSHLVEQYKRLSPEISRNFINQHFDINTLSHNIERLETIDIKIRDLQNSLPEIRKYMKAETTDIELVIRQFANDLFFDQMGEAEEWIDSVIHELERRKQERIDRNEQWKSAGIAVIKNSASFLWRTINK